MQQYGFSLTPIFPYSHIFYAVCRKKDFASEKNTQTTEYGAFMYKCLWKYKQKSYLTSFSPTFFFQL